MNNDQGLPWSVFHNPGEHYIEIQDNEGMDVALFYCGVPGDPMAEPAPADRAKAEQRASLICQAVNAYASLLEALELVNQLLKGKYRGENTLTTVTFGPGHVAIIREALRLARGGQR